MNRKTSYSFGKETGEEEVSSFFFFLPSCLFPLSAQTYQNFL